MSQRTQFTVQLINDSNGQPVANIPVTVTDRTSGAIIAPFVDETSQIYTANLQTDANGLAQGWVPLGGYLATATSAFLSVPYAVAFDSVPWTTISGGVTTSVSGGLQPLTVVAAITSSVTLTAGQLTPVNAAGTSLTETLPTGKPAGTLLAVEKVDSSANTVTVTGSIQGSNTSIILKLINEMVTFQTDSAGSWWPIGGRLPLSGLDARYDATGAATTALSSAQTFATSAVGVETSRAEAAEALLAPLNSPVLTGSPQAPNPVFGDNSTNIATTNWVKQVASGVAGVSSVFTRAGAIVAVSGDYSAAQVTNAATQSFVSGAITSAVSTETTRATTAEALLAPLASPTLTGTPTAPTPSVNDNSTTLATTSFVKLIASGVGGVSSVFTRVGPVVANTGDYTVAQVTGAAPTVNPTFSGVASSPLFSISGVPGSTSGSRNVGTTVSGSPSVGIYKQGDFAHDLSGNVWTCIVAGSPGQWAGNLSNIQVNSPPVLVANTFPTVTGTYIQGQALTDVTPATWLNSPTGYNYQWQRCSASGTGCANIGGATSQAYTLQAADINNTVRVGETAFNANGTATSTAFSLVIQVVNVSAPVISGQNVVGNVLSVSTGSWTGNPVAFTYQWQRCDANGANAVTIGGATSATYTLVSGDIGSTIRCLVTAYNASDSTNQQSAATVVIVSNAVPANLTLPIVTGTTVQGQTLSTTSGTWAGSPTSYAYQWRSSGTTISGATSPTYVLQAPDVGNTINSTIIASNATGASLPASSIGVGPITGSSAPVNTALPAILGTPQDGQTLTVSNGTWTASPAITGYTYQWYRVPTASGAPTVVQSLHGTGNASASPVAFAFSSNITNTNTLIVMATCKSGSGDMSVSGVTKSAGTATVGTFTKLESLTGFAGTLDGEIWTASVTGTGSCTVSVAFAGTLSANAEAIACMEVSGLSGFDAGATASGSGTVASVTSPTPATAAEFMFACAFLSAAATISPSGSPWTTSTGPQTFSVSINPAAWGQTSGTSPLTASWTQGTTSSYWIAMCALFKGVSGSIASIGGASSATYTAIAADVGNTLLCAVTATNAAGSTTVNSAATSAVIATGTNSPISQLTDIFAGTSLGTQWTTVQGTATVASNLLTVADTATPTLVASSTPYALTNSAIFAAVAPSTSTGVYTALTVSQNQGTAGPVNLVEIHTIGSTIYATLIQAGVSADFGSTTYNATTMAYWQVRESASTLYAEYSNNGTTWTVLGSTTYTLSLAAVYAQLEGGTNSTAGQTSTFAQINQVTQPPTPPPPGQFIPSGPFTTNVFFDDFTGTSLNASNWHATNYNGSNTDDPNGGYTGFGISSMLSSSVAVGTFTPPGGTATSCVRLTAPSSTSGANITTQSTGFWVSGSHALQSFNHGTFVARMWMPPGQGMWPAFWINTTDGYVPPGTLGAEVDMVEMIMGPNTNTNLGFFDYNSSNVWQTVHLPGTQNNQTQGYNLGYNASTGWTTFGTSFSVPSAGNTGTITFYVNNIQTHQLTGFTWPPTASQNWYMLLTLAMYQNPTNTYPQHLYIDWVGVWQ